MEQHFEQERTSDATESSKHLNLDVKITCDLYIYIIVPVWYASREFGQAMVRTLGRRIRGKITLARPNETHTQPKHTQIGTIRSLWYPNSSKAAAILGH